MSVVTSTCLRILGKTEHYHIMYSVELVVMTKVHARMRLSRLYLLQVVYLFSGRHVDAKENL